MSDLSNLNEDCLESLFKYTSLEDLVNCRNSTESWKNATDSQVKWWIEKFQKFVDDYEIILSQSPDWRRLCKYFMDQKNIEDIARFSKLLIDSFSRIERPINRWAHRIEFMDPFHIAVLEGNVEVIKFLLQHVRIFGKYLGKTAFILACEQRDKEIIMLFIENQWLFSILSDVDSNGRSGFAWLCHHGMNGIIESVIDKTKEKIHQIQISGTEEPCQPIQSMIEENSYAGQMFRKKVEFWQTMPLEYPTDNEGKTPLMLATVKNNQSLINLLIAKGADINAADKTGKTPLIHAVWQGDLELVKLYFSYGNEKKIDFNIADIRGRTAYMYSCFFSMTGIIELFRQNAEEFQIDLLKKDTEGLIGSDYLEAVNIDGEVEFDYNPEPIKAEEWNKMDRTQRRKRLIKGRDMFRFETDGPYGSKKKVYDIDEDMPEWGQIGSGYSFRGTPAEIQAERERFAQVQAARQEAAREEAAREEAAQEESARENAA